VELLDHLAARGLDRRELGRRRAVEQLVKSRSRGSQRCTAAPGAGAHRAARPAGGSSPLRDRLLAPRRPFRPFSTASPYARTMFATVVLTGGYEIRVQGDPSEIANALLRQDRGFVVYPTADDGRDVYLLVDHVIAIVAHAGH